MATIPDAIGTGLVTSGDYQFASWYTRAGELRIGRILRSVQRWGVDHDEYQIEEPLRTTPLALPRVNDGHNFSTIAVDGLGKLHVWANMQADPLRAIATTAAHTTNGWLSASGWTSAASAFPSVGAEVTYPFPCQLPDGGLLFYLLSHPAGPGSGMSDSLLWRRAPDGTTWATPVTLFQGLSVPDAKGPGVPGDPHGTDTEYNWNAYPNGSIIVESDRAAHPGRLHLCWAWRVDGLDGRTTVLPAYAYSDDQGVSWRAVDGTACPLPFTPLNNIPARVPKHGRILSISRQSFVVSATLDTPNHGIVPGDTITVRVPQDSSFDGTPTVVTVNGATIGGWGQLLGNATVNLSGYVGRDNYINGMALAVDDDSRPHITFSEGPWWWIRHNGTSWEQTQIPNPLHGVTHIGAGGDLAWLADRVWLVKKSSTGPATRRPRLWQLDQGDGMVVMGGPVNTTGDALPFHDPEALRRFGTIEVLTCDGDDPRVYTFGRGPRAVAADAA